VRNKILFQIIAWTIWALLLLAVILSAEGEVLRQYTGELGHNLLIMVVVILPILIVLPIILPLLKTLAEVKNSTDFFGNGSEAKRILETGRSANATLIAVNENSQGGMLTINDQPYLNLKLAIDDGKNPAYEVSFDSIVPRTILPQLTPGAKLKVKIDPQNPQKIVLDQTR